MTEDCEGYAARCVEHGFLDMAGHRSREDAIEIGGNHIDYDHQEVAA